MSWIYQQSTGKLFLNDKLIIRGYSGQPPYTDKPGFQNLKDRGPIPRGKWKIMGVTSSKGPLTIVLVPEKGTNTFGRDNFRIHGEKVGATPGFASHGCIIISRTYREQIIKSHDKTLEVVY